jgi:hypothetical protein
MRMPRKLGIDKVNCSENHQRHPDSQPMFPRMGRITSTFGSLIQTCGQSSISVALIATACAEPEGITAKDFRRKPAPGHLFA